VLDELLLLRLLLAGLLRLLLAGRRFGTLPPERLASDSPIAIACLRLVTFRPDPPERSLPRFISCIERSTFLLALGP
ncbi:MAG TPA: hypothetical protein VK524_11575, partial [Polyangiaceae bacterium]|nr:hypothetical protein [Polyangiaceae bacterium]